MDVGESRIRPQAAVLKFKTAKECATFWKALHFFKVKVVDDLTGKMFRPSEKIDISEASYSLFVNSNMLLRPSKKFPFAIGLSRLLSPVELGNYPEITLPQAIRVIKTLRTGEINAQEEEKNR